MSNSRPSDSSRTTRLDIDGLMRDTVAMERIAGALEAIADALTLESKLKAQEFEIAHPTKPVPRPVTVFQAKYRTERDQENEPIPIEDEVEIDPMTGQTKVKPGVRFSEEPKVRGAAASRRKN